MATTEARLEESGAQLASDAEGQQAEAGPGAANGACASPAASGGEEQEKPLPALFLDSVPDDAGSHPDLAGLNIMMGELTPEERADNEKVCSSARQSAS